MAAIYRGMDQAELDAQYNARATVRDFEAEMSSYRALTAQSYERLTAVRDIQYGPHPDEKIDLFPSSDTKSPLMVFIHGGYWRALGRAESGFMAETFVTRGVSVAVVEYSLAPAVSVDHIVQQVRRAIAHLIANAATLGFDPGRVFLGGSSAGAHLAAMAMITDWQARFGLAGNAIRGALLASGLYDLEPVRLCEPNAWLRLDRSAALRNSPIHTPPPTGTDLLIVWGGSETDEFKRQSRDYAQMAQEARCNVQAYEVSDRNHFDIVTDLARPDRQLFRDTMAMIRSDAP